MSRTGRSNLSRETSFSGANGGREKNIFICSAYNEQDCQPYPVDPYSTENADHTNTDYLHELLPSLPPSVSPQNLPARLLFPASRPSQPLAPHIRAPGAQDSRTNHSACAQVATRPADLLLALTLALFGGGGISGCFTLLRALAFPSAVTFFPAIKAVTVEIAVESFVRPLAAIRRGGSFLESLRPAAA